MSITPLPNADFAPTMAGYSGQKPFRFWCQTVLPLVYDDSLSYYELLNKVVNYLNNTIEDVASVEDNVDGLLSAYNQLQDYVNDYFSELDVQEEIDLKLDEMASSGALNVLIDPVIAESTTAWLAENVDPVGSAVVVNTSLTVEGAAADAKVVGDELAKTLRYNPVTASTAESVYNSTSANLPIRTYSYINTSWFDDMSGVPSNRSGWIFFLAQSATIGRMQIFVDFVNGKRYTRYRNTTGDFSSWRTLYETDKTLTVSDMAADAKVVGDIFKDAIKYKLVSESSASSVYDSKIYNLTINTFSWIDLSWFDDGPISSGTAWVKTEGVITGTFYRQIVSVSNGKTYERIYSGGSLGSWHFAYENTMIRRGNYTSSVSSLDSLTEPGCYMFSDPHTSVSNAPTERAMMVMVDHINSTTPAQICFDLYFGVMFSRYYSSNAWREWNSYSFRFNSLSQSQFNTQCSGLLSNLPRNTISYLSADWASDSPRSGYYYFITIGAPSYRLQLALNINGIPSFCRIYSSGAYQAWKNLSGRSNDCKIVAYGDSTTYGEYPGGGSTRNGNRWIRNLADYLEATHVNYGARGQGLVKDWGTIISSIESEDLSDANLIIAAWAYNDANEYVTQGLSMGSATDTDPDTSVVGKYYDVLKRLQNKNPNATVILMTGYGYSTNGSGQFTRNLTFADGSHTIKEFYDTLESMCHLRGFSCINQAKGCWVNDLTWSSLVGNTSSGGTDNIHPTSNGYKKYSDYVVAKVSAIYANCAKH